MKSRALGDCCHVVFEVESADFNIVRGLLHAETLAAIKADKSLAEIRAPWKRDIDEYVKRREKYLIYR